MASSDAPSRAWQSMKLAESHHRGVTGEIGEVWENRWYSAIIYRRDVPLFPGAPAGHASIQVVNVDQSARHDWRDFQRIKNDLVGDEWEAVELYPAESRLVDPSNAFYLWCAPRGAFDFGLCEGQRRRLVLDVDRSIAPQRRFPVEQPSA